MTYRSIRLSDGRQLGFLDKGAGAGKPLFFFPGFGVSAYAACRDDPASPSLGVRVISVDRPGIGRSSPAPGRALLDWPRDIAELADRLNFERFALLGWSAGGPPCAGLLPCAPWPGYRNGAFAGAPPFSEAAGTRALPLTVRLLAFVARRLPQLVRLQFVSHCRRIHRQSPEKIMSQAARDLCEADRRLLADPMFHDLLTKSMVEACSQGSEGLADDVLALARPWGFPPDDVMGPIWLWHGEADAIIPAEVSRWYSRRIPNSSLRLFKGAGHFGYLTHWREIVTTLTADADPNVR